MSIDPAPDHIETLDYNSTQPWRACCKAGKVTLNVLCDRTIRLIYRQAIIKLSRGVEPDNKQMQSIVGLVFFGVPHRGMDIQSLRAMVGDQPNRYILESIGPYSDLLVEQDVRFGLDFHYRDSPIFSFFETRTSPTALKVSRLIQHIHPNTHIVRLMASGRWRANKDS